MKVKQEFEELFGLKRYPLSIEEKLLIAIVLFCCGGMIVCIELEGNDIFITSSFVILVISILILQRVSYVSDMERLDRIEIVLDRRNNEY